MSDWAKLFCVLMKKKIEKPLQDCCNRNGKEIFIPSGREIRKYKIIVSTLFNAAR